MTTTAHPPAPPRAAPARRVRLLGRARKLVLTVHIASAVALIGTTLGIVVMGLRTAGRDDAAGAHAVYETMELLTFSLGIPLSFIALISGIVVAVGGKWGLFGYWWVTTKFALLILVIVLGATVTGNSVGRLVEVTETAPPGESAARLTVVLGAGAQCLMLIAATVLSVFRPGGRLRRRAA